MERKDELSNVIDTCARYSLNWAECPAYRRILGSDVERSRLVRDPGFRAEMADAIKQWANEWSVRETGREMFPESGTVTLSEGRLREIISESINKALGDKYGQDLFNHTLEGMEITNFVAQGIADGEYSFVATLNNGQAILKGVASDYYDASISSYMLLYKSITLNGKEYKVSIKRNSVDSRIENEIDRRLTDGIGNGSIKQYGELTINESRLRDIIRNVISEAIGEEGIHIKEKNRGKFNATKERTGKSTEELTHSKNPLTRKRAIFAQNAKKWNKKK